MHAIKRLFLHAGWVRKNRERTLIIIFGFTLTCVAGFLYLLQPLVLSTLDLKLYDTQLKIRPERGPSPDLIIVDIDTKSLSQYGQWPWPRYRIAKLMDNLREMGALSVGVDILFAEPDRSSLGNIQRNISADFDYTINLSGVPRRYIDNDALLADALTKGPFVLGYQFLFGEQSKKVCMLNPVNVLIRNDPDVRDSADVLFHSSAVDCPYPMLASAVSSSGFFNIQSERDGIIRWVPLIMEYDGRLYSHLSLAVLISALRPEHMVLRVGQTGTESLFFKGTEIPLEQKAKFLIPFHASRGMYHHISAADILSGTAGRKEIQGHIVIIGMVAPGLLDIHPTPTDPAMSGVEVLANIMDAILQRDFLVRPKAAVAYEFFATLLFGLLSAVLLARCKIMTNLLIFSLFIAAILILTILLFHGGIYLSPLYPILAYTSNLSLLSLFNFWRKEMLLREKTKLQLATQEAMIETIANITETRDPETGGHIKRTSSYVKALAEHIKHKPEFEDTIDDAYIEHLCQSAALHDVGKVGIPDHILLKPGRLTAEEFEEIKRHTQYGRRVIEAAQAKLGDTSFLMLAGEMAFSHHERWDGKGYPVGLKGLDIPLSG
ncbi:MAG TPA: CHASE2 domain-containing protein, partial [Dissulfurispiraceae bacterium]|nr:CHASE2 domain-containing protein [Dissulfurispiraceae bacterium]